MYITPKNIKIKAGTSFTFLDKKEVLKETDLVRSTVYFDDYYSQDAVDDMNWQLVRDRMPGWIGRTIEEFEKFSKAKSHMEIIRINS